MSEIGNDLTLLVNAARVSPLLRDAAVRTEQYIYNLHRLILMSIDVEGDHECRGKCPDTDDEGIRDPDCLACAAVDFPAYINAEQKR